jgi:OmcA/MtrC family decaheme c-type cytochrome
MKLRNVAPTLMALLLGALAGCGGGGGGGAAVAVPNAANSGGTITGITVNSPPVVTFVVNDSTGKPISGLKLSNPTGTLPADPACNNSNITFAIARFDGANWQSLISRQRYATSAAGQNSVIEGTTDPKPAAGGYINPETAVADPSTRIVGILEEANGVYTYRFATDVSAPLLMANAVDKKNVSLGKVANNGNLAVKDGKTLHRVAMQLCYVDPVTQMTMKLNPYMDFTLGADGRGNPNLNSQGDLTPAHKVVERAACNECHQNFAQHGGNRVEPNYCVMCHNPGSSDFQTGNPIDFKLMVHKFHMGKRLSQDYAVRSAVARKDTAGVISGVLYPQDQRNCVKCHDGSATATHKTAQGDNWKSKASKNACLACHDDYKTAGSAWQIAHTPYSSRFIPSVANPDTTADAVCQSCHNNAGGGVAKTIAEAHVITEWVLGEKYRLNLWNISRNANNSLTVEYSVSDPAAGTDYDLLDAALTARFSSLSLLFGWNTTDYANDGGNARGQPFSARVTTDASVQRVGTSNRFRLTSSVLPPAANGSVAVAFQGRINEAGLRVPVANAVKYFAMSGNTVDRRQVVSLEKCNACHGRFIGYTSLTTNNPGLGAHGANRNDPQVCVICHNGNNPLNGTVVAGGAVTRYAQSADFKNMIHRMHAEQEENYPVWPLVKSTKVNMTTKYAGLKNCNVCHVGDSHKQNNSVLGTSVTYAVDTSIDSTNAAVTDIDASDNLVVSPQASACASCHSSDNAKAHMANEGGAVFGTVTQGALAAGAVFESCEGCHAPGAMRPVDSVHQGN